MQQVCIVFQMSVLEACNNRGHTHTRLHGTQTNDDNETQVTLRATCKRALALEKVVWKTQAQDTFDREICSFRTPPHPSSQGGLGHSAALSEKGDIRLRGSTSTLLSTWP